MFFFPLSSWWPRTTFWTFYLANELIDMGYEIHSCIWHFLDIVICCSNSRSFSFLKTCSWTIFLLLAFLSVLILLLAFFFFVYIFLLRLRTVCISVGRRMMSVAVLRAVPTSNMTQHNEVRNIRHQLGPRTRQRTALRLIILTSLHNLRSTRLDSCLTLSCLSTSRLISHTKSPIYTFLINLQLLSKLNTFSLLSYYR